jgi:hypothetical protein
MSLRPHPLVTGLAARLEQIDDAATEPRPATSSDEAADRLPDLAGEEQLGEQRDDSRSPLHLGSALAGREPPDIITFAGYLGDLVRGSTGDAPWRVLYLTLELNSWLMVREESILLHDRLADATAAFGQRDVIWVEATAEILRGSAPPAKVVAQKEFLTGDFTRAADFAASVSGLSGSAQTGLFCGAATPLCRPRP